MNWADLISSRRLGEENKTGKTKDEERSDFERDYDRVVFSSAFRQLQDKTQVIPFPKKDFVHSRLTHSLEVSCVGRTLGKMAGIYVLEQYPSLQKETGITSSGIGAIVAAASLAHDIGNPPFGHSGEKAIAEFFLNGEGSRFKNLIDDDHKWNDLIKFEGNANGFRTLTNSCNTMKGGAGLTYSTLSAFTKYPKVSWPEHNSSGRISEKKFGFFQSEKELYKEIAGFLKIKPGRAGEDFNWCRHPLAYLVEAADDICYSIIDFEDGLRLGLIPEKTGIDLLSAISKGDLSMEKLKQIPSATERYGYLRAKAINALVNDLSDIFKDKEAAMLNGDYHHSLLDDSKLYPVIKEIKNISVKKVYCSEKVLEIEAAGYEIIGGLLSIFINAVNDLHAQKKSWHSKKIIDLIPEQYIGPGKKPADDLYLRIIHICEFIAGMTDSYAISFYRKLKGIELPEG